MQTLNELLAQQDNDYSHLEQDYYRRTQTALVDDPYASIQHPLADITLSVSIVIPAYNAAATLEQCLIAIEQSSFHQKYPHLLEVVVVDDGSSDATWQLLEQSRVNLNLKAVRQANRGCGQARNTGVAVSEGDIIICCDADMVLLPFTIEELVKRHQLLDKVLLIGFRTYMDLANPSMQPEALPAQLKTFVPTFFGDIRLFYIGGWNLCRETDHLKRLGYHKYIFRPNATWRTLEHQVHGALFSIRRSEYLSIGGCDETFHGWGYEDTLFAARAIARGNYVIPVYAASGLHLTPTDALPTTSPRLNAKDRQQWQEGAANALYYRQQLYTPPSPPAHDWLQRMHQRVERVVERRTSSTSGCGELDAQYFESYRSVKARPYLRGLYFFQLGRWEEALQAFAQVHGSARDVADAQWIRAKALRISGQTEAAVETFKEILSSYPINPDTYIEYALALARQERFEEARKQLQRASEMSTSHPLLQWLLKRPAEEFCVQAELYLRQGDHALALQEYDLALIAEPSSLLAQVNRAKTLAAQGEVDAARHARDTYLSRLNPARDGNVQAELTNVWEQVERRAFGRAKVLLEQALHSHPKVAWPRDLLNEIHQVVLREAPLPLTQTLLHAVETIPGPLNRSELSYLSMLTIQTIVDRTHGSHCILIDSNGYCGQATVLISLVARKLQVDHVQLFSLYQPVEEPIMIDDSALRCMYSRDVLQAQLWRHQLMESVACVPEQGVLPKPGSCQLLLLQGADLPREADDYSSLLAEDGLLLVHPYCDERPDVQHWVDERLQCSSYIFLGQVDSLIALKVQRGSPHLTERQRVEEGDRSSMYEGG